MRKVLAKKDDTTNAARTGSRLGKKQEVINEAALEHKKMVEHKKTSVAVKPG